MNENVSVLLIEDNQNIIDLLKEYLSDYQIFKFQITVAAEYNAARMLLSNKDFDSIIIDLDSYTENGLQFVKSINRFSIKPAIIVLVSKAHEKLGVKTLQYGVSDYLVKEKLNKDIILHLIKYAITDKTNQNKIKHLNSILQATQKINKLIAHVENEDDLITNTCNILVKSKGYHSAWIILYDNNNKITHKAYKGLNSNINQLFVSFENRNYPKCIYNALETKDFVISHNPEKECVNCPISDNLKGKSVLVKRLEHKNTIFGLTGVSVPPEFAFNNEELQLFEEVTNDISFAIYNFAQSREKQHIAKKYREEQKKLNTLINNIPGVAFRCRYDEFWTMEYLSNACSDILGYSPEEIIENKVIAYDDIVHPSVKEVIRSQISEQIKTKGRYSIEYSIITKYGDEKWIWESGIPELDSENNITHLDGYITDITDNKQALDKLLESEEKYRFLAENSIDCIWTMNTRLKFKYLSPSLYNITGYKPEEWIDQPLYKFTSLKHFAKMARLALRTLVNPKKYPHVIFESVIIAKDSKEIPVEITGKALLDTKGKIIGLQGTTKDITERIANHKALIESETKFRALYDNSPDMYVSVSPDNGKIILCNKTLLTTLKYTKEEVLGKSVLDMYHEESREEAKKAFELFKKNVSIRDKELKLKKKDGSSLYVSLNVEAIKNEKGEVLYSMSSWRDITEKKQTAEMLKKQNERILKQIHEYQALNEEYQALNENLYSSNAELQEINLQLKEAKEKAEENEKLKSAFMANVSHEIRTPMNAIVGFSNLLRDEQLSHDRRIYFIDLINSAGDRLLQLINDIIDVSKLEAKQLKLIPVEFNLCEVFQNTYDYFVRCDLLLKKPDITLRVNISDQIMNCIIRTDRTRFQQVLDNLINNAIKYTKEGIIEFGYKICNTDKGEYIEVFVRDTGIGIEKDKAQLIFERFRQIQESDYHEGAGLGLSIAKGIVDLLGGEIWFNSEPYKGSTFYFTIPYIPDKITVQNNIIVKTEKLNLSDKLILIAEDDFNSYVYLKELLKDTKAEIKYAQNGLELLDLMEPRKPDLILLDINMPVMSGYEFLHRIREKGIQVKIIAQTAYAMTDEEIRCYKEGCNGYISKPFSKSELFETIEKVMI